MPAFKYSSFCIFIFICFVTLSVAKGEGGGESIVLEEFMRDMGVRPTNFSLQSVVLGGSIWTTVIETGPALALGFTTIQKGDRLYFLHLEEFHWLVYSPAHNQRIKVKIRRHINPFTKPRIQVTAVYR